MDFLFLPPIYLVSLIVSGIATGLIFRHVTKVSSLLDAGILFLVFTISQLIFRIISNEMPERLIGQAIYFILFLVVVWVTVKVKERIIG